MKITDNQPFVSTLPADDDHPYRTGTWQPQVTEYDAWDLDVQGKIPEDLTGIYGRNTENPLMEAIGTYHPFDGDAMLHSLSFSNGDAVYRNRFVRTEGLLAEQAAGEALWAGAATKKSLTKVDYGWGARELMKDASSTDVVVHNGAILSSFWMCGDLYRHDPATMDALGVESWDGKFPQQGVSAHAKVDVHTGEMLFFNYDNTAPFMHYGVVGPTGQLTHYTDIALPGSRLPHDMAITENYSILSDFPLFWDPAALANGANMARFHRDMPSRFGILPRYGDASSIQWFEADPTFVLHFTNAYEDGDEIVLDGFFQSNPMPDPVAGLSRRDNVLRYLDMYALQARPHRWRFNLKTGQTSEMSTGDGILEFSAINNQYLGRKARYAYCALPCEGWFGFEGLVKHDLVTDEKQVVQLPEGVFCSEAVVAAKDGADTSTPDGEEDAYVLTFVSDMNNDSSSCLIYEAADLGAGPVATVRLPERIASGTHATWGSADAIAPLI
jgi:carotenoid cleavage dioxygenase